MARQQHPDRALRRHPLARPIPLQPRPQLLRAPVRIFTPQRQHRFRQLLRQRIARIVRRPAAVNQSRRPLRLVAVPPLVAAPTAHPVAPAQPRKAIIFRAIVHAKRHPIVHDTGLVPNHRHLLADAFYLLPMSSDYSVTHLSGSDPPYPSPTGGKGIPVRLQNLPLPLRWGGARLGVTPVRKSTRLNSSPK